MDEPSAIPEIRARLAALRAEREVAGGAASPATPPTPDQLGAMRETMGILSDPDMLARVGAARRAVAGADVVRLQDVSDAIATKPGGWRVALAGPVARELAAAGAAADAVFRELLDVLLNDPAQGRALGFGLAGMRSLQNEQCRVLYAIDDGQRVVTILSLDRH